MRQEKVSIAMALCNGEKYMKQQIDSILSQLTDNDELILSCDPSYDATESIARMYEKEDKRVKVILNKEHSRGLVSNFDNALRWCTGDIIFFADQDDVWMEDKIDKVLKMFEQEDTVVVIHDAVLCDEKLTVLEKSTFRLRGGARAGFWKNWIRLSYIGCCMAFRAKLLPVILPIPMKKRSHDWWTGSICSCFGKMAIVEEALIMHRMHNSNATPKKRPSIKYQVSARLRLLFNVFLRRWLYN